MVPTSGQTVPAAHTASVEGNLSWSQWFSDLFVRRRVRIMGGVLVLLILEDFFAQRLRPRSPIDVGDLYAMLGVAVVTLGVALRSWAAGTLHKNSQLTTSGPYAVVRHPLYIGSFLTMLGFCTLINDRGENFLVVAGPLLAMFIFRAHKEDRLMVKKFPSEWNDYKRRVGPCFPKSWPQNVFGNWSWRQWATNREYRFLGAILLGLAALQAWHLYE